MGSKAVSQVYWKPGDSHFWAGLMATKKYSFRYGSFSIKNGSEIRFWEDKWLGNATLRNNIQLYTILYVTRMILLPRFLETFPSNVTFRRDLIGPRLQSWNILLQRFSMVQLSHGSDVFHWNLHGNGKFSVESMYRALLLMCQPIITRRSGR